MSGAVIIVKQNRLMQSFADAGATSFKTAVVPDDIGCRQHWIFRRLVSRGVFVPVGDGRFYLDMDAATEFKRCRRTKAIIVLVVTLVVVAFWLLLVAQ